MQITKEATGYLNALIKIKIEPLDYQEKVDKKFREYRKKAKIPGFRPGMVPMGVIKNMIGKTVMAEEINTLLNDSIYNYLDQNKIEVLGQPLPLDEKHSTIDFSFQKEFEFQYELGLAPQFAATISSRDIFTRYVINIDKDLFEQYINNIAKKHGKMKEMEECGETDTLQGEFIELDTREQKTDDPTGHQVTYKTAGIKHSSTFSLLKIDESIKKKFIGLKTGNKVYLNTATIYGGEVDLAVLLGITIEEAKNLKSDFEFTVNKIHRHTPAEINQELFSKLFSDGSVTTLEEFNKRITESLKLSLENESNIKLKNDFKKTLLEKYKPRLPDDFLKRWLGKINKETSAEQVEIEYVQFSNNLRWELISKKIMKEYNITVSNEEIHEYIKNYVRNFFVSDEKSDISETALEDIVHRELENKESLRKYYLELSSDKLNDLFAATFTIQDKVVTRQEFAVLLNRKI